MPYKSCSKGIITLIIAIIIYSCSNHNVNQMNEADHQQILNEIYESNQKLTDHSEKAKLDSFLSYYDHSKDFTHISMDGKMRTYEEFKNLCSEYYNTLKEQKISTLIQKYDVIDRNIVILCWTGNITARFKNGDIMKMNNYSITSVFKKSEGRWKIIHAHESSLPPETIKAAN